MKNRSTVLAVILTLLLFQFKLLLAQKGETDTIKTQRMQWFADAKLGIFIHWGIYAVNGVSESWSFHNGEVAYDAYMKQLDGFTAAKYQPHEWSKLIKESGARYAVLTAKHHDGVALWNSKAGGINVVKNTPAKRDLIKPFTDALRKDNIKVGLYFSLIDWSYSNYDKFTKTETRYTNDSTRWKKFLTYYRTQLNEITQNYKPDLYWFDGDWEHTAEEWQAKEVKEEIMIKNPAAIVNSRLAGYGDYDTPEQGVPVFKPKAMYWELCLTTNDNWGYRPSDTSYKSVNQVIDIFVDCLSKGGNLLLDIGPRADGTIDERQASILKGLGNWVNKNSTAVYGTIAGIPLEYTNSPTSLSADSTILYLYIKGYPGEAVYLKGIINEVKSASIVYTGLKLKAKVIGKLWWSSVPGIIRIELPVNCCDKDVTVIAIKLNDKIRLWGNK